MGVGRTHLPSCFRGTGQVGRARRSRQETALPCRLACYLRAVPKPNPAYGPVLALTSCTLAIAACATMSAAPLDPRSPPPASSKAQHILGSFAQGGAGNCASISVIKLALYEYGFDGTFSQVGSDAGPFRLRDGTDVVVTDADVRTVAEIAAFETPPLDADLEEQAYRMLAVMAKHKCKENGGCATVADAFDRHDHFLDESTQQNFHWLGLDHQAVAGGPPADLHMLAGVDGYVVTNAKHSAFGFDGVYDEHGHPLPVQSFEEKHSTWWSRTFKDRKVNGVFTLRPPAIPANPAAGG